MAEKASSERATSLLGLFWVNAAKSDAGSVSSHQSLEGVYAWYAHGSARSSRLAAAQGAMAVSVRRDLQFRCSFKSTCTSSGRWNQGAHRLKKSGPRRKTWRLVWRMLGRLSGHRGGARHGSGV